MTIMVPFDSLLLRDSHREILENERVIERSWNMKKNDKKSWNFVISHGILQILSPNFTKFVLFMPTLKDVASV